MIVDATLGALVVQAPLSFSATGDNIIVPGLIGKLTKVLQLIMVFGGATGITFKSGVNPLSGEMYMVQNGTFVLDYIQCPITCYSAGDNFIMNLDPGVMVGGMIWYIRI